MELQLENVLEAKLMAGIAAWESDQYNDASRLLAEFFHETAVNLSDSDLHLLRMRAFPVYGRTLIALGQVKDALELYYQYQREAGDEDLHAIDAMILIGDCLSEMNEGIKALIILEEALQAAKACHFLPGLARAHSALGNIYDRLGRLDESLTHLMEARSLFADTQDQEGMTKVLTSIGISHFYAGQLDKSIEIFEEVLQVARQMNQRTVSIALSNLGECYQRLGDMRAAVTYHEQALKIAQEIGLPTTEADAYRNLGLDLVALGQTEKGTEHLYKALALSLQYSLFDVQVQTYYSLTLAELTRGNYKAAFSFAEMLREFATKHHIRTHMTNALHVLGLYHECVGELQIAEEMWQKGLYLAHETGQKIRLWQIHACLARIAHHPVLAGVHYRSAADAIRQIAAPIEDKGLRERFLSGDEVVEILYHAKY